MSRKRSANASVTRVRWQLAWEEVEGPQQEGLEDEEDG